jgi:hypothetical protein
MIPHFHVNSRYSICVGLESEMEVIGGYMRGPREESWPRHEADRGLTVIEPVNWEMVVAATRGLGAGWGRRTVWVLTPIGPDR